MAEPALPKVTVGVCTYRRPELLRLTLESLMQQTLPASDFEVVVVDNDTERSAQALVESLTSRPHGPTLRYFVEPGRGVSHVRNQCVAQARGDWLAFIDDDEEARPDWLSQLLSAQQRYSADVVLGPVNPLLPDDAISGLSGPQHRQARYGNRHASASWVWRGRQCVNQAIACPCAWRSPLSTRALADGRRRHRAFQLVAPGWCSFGVVWRGLGR